MYSKTISLQKANLAAEIKKTEAFWRASLTHAHRLEFLCNRYKIISVGGSKGGTGKTFVAVNAAVQLACRGLRVLLIDCDDGLPNAEMHLNVSQGEGVLRGASDHIYNFLDIHGKVSSVYTLLGSKNPENKAIINDTRGEQAAPKFLNKFIAPYNKKTFSLFTDYDAVIIDTSAGAAFWQTVPHFMSDESYIVATAEPSSLLGALNQIRTIIRSGDPYRRHKIRFIFNSLTPQDTEHLMKQARTKNLSQAMEAYYKKKVEDILRHGKFIPKRHIDLKYSGYIFKDPEYGYPPYHAKFILQNQRDKFPDLFSLIEKSYKRINERTQQKK